MKKLSSEEYMALQNREWEWAKALIQCQIDDPRPGVEYLTNRPVIDLKQMLESSVSLYGDRTAYYTKFEKGPYQEIKYSQLLEDVNGLGTQFIAMGLKDKRIAVIGETTYMWSIAYLAAVNGTGVVVPLDKELPYDDLKNLIKESEASAVLFDRKREDIFVRMFEEGDTGLEYIISQDRKTGDGAIISQWELVDAGKKLVENGDRSFLDAQIDNEEMSIIIFTSGTTGMAKGIMLSHKNICADLMVSPVFVDLDETDIFFSVLPIHHTFECTCDFLMPLYKGAAIAHCEGLKYITKNLQEVKPTYFLAVPAIFDALYKAIWKGIRKKGKEKTVRTAMKVSDFLRRFGIDITDRLFAEIKSVLGGRMRMMISGGAAINPDILEDLQSFGIHAIQGYGLSEAAPMGALNPQSRPKSHSCGMAFPGFDAKIADPGSDGVGEICLKGDNIMLGYYRNPEATAEVIRDGWFYTGDLGYIDDEGYIVITGRKKNVIIAKNGKNVFPEELEYQLSLYDEIAEAMAFETDSEDETDKIIAVGIYPDWNYMKETYGDRADDDEEVRKIIWEIVDKVNAENPAYKMIRKVNLRHSEFSKNTSKKIVRFREENKMED
ncbi:MAG: AMP-binding protein [Clostridiales bacterium]|nr:AMP-binding protein [Clostridiales bacterium]